MSDQLKRRWLIVALIWLSALSVTVLNRHKIGRIIGERQRAEILQKDHDFWKQNTKNINTVLQKWDTAFQRVESLNLGLLALENKLVTTAGKHELSNVKVDVQAEQDDGFGIPGEVSFSGPLDGAMAMLGDLEKDYPFLPVRALDVKFDDTKMQVRFKLLFYYRHKIVGAEDEVS